MIFKNRREAGKLLAQKLKTYLEADSIVLGLARGGVPVAYEISKALQIPLNTLVVRKIGAPLNPELALGAIAETGASYLNRSLIQGLGVSSQYLAQETAVQRELARKRVALYRPSPLDDLAGRQVILVDDGIATGATMFAAVEAMRELGASNIIVAAPVGATETLRELTTVADTVVCLHGSETLGAIGYFYEEFGQTSDKEVIFLLKENTFPEKLG